MSPLALELRDGGSEQSAPTAMLVLTPQTECTSDSAAVLNMQQLHGLSWRQEPARHGTAESY